MNKDAASYMAILAAERNAVFEQVLIALVNKDEELAFAAGVVLARVAHKMESIIRSQMPKPPVTELVIYDRGYDHHVSIPNTRLWASGSNEFAAIGNFIMTHYDKLGIKIVRK